MMNWTKNINRIGLMVLAICSLIQFSCNEEFPNILKEEYNNAEIEGSLNKVLIVAVDGIRGNAMTDIDPENMRVIARNAFYSNSSLGDFEKDEFTKEKGLANLFTGVTSAKHGVTSDLAAINTEEYPTLFERLKSNYTGFDSKGYTTNSDVNEYLFEGIDVKELLQSDEEVISKTKVSLLDEDTELVVCHLSNIEKVGNAHSFETSDANYREAILTFDEQIKELVNTIKERPNYKGENWLIVISSSVGGDITYVDPDDDTVYADNKRNIFTYFYSPSFARKYQAKPSTASLPFTGSGLRLTYGSTGDNSTSARLTDVNKLNFTASDDFTITFFFKQNIADSHFNYPAILMKRKGTDDGNGWQFVMSGGQIEARLGGGSKFKSADVTDAKWHAITLSVDRAANTAKIYTDGELSAQTAAGSGSDLASQEPLIFGKHPGGGANSGDFTVCNLQVYNVAMTDEEVKEYAGIALVKSDNSPFYENLLGYWPGYEDNGERFLTDVTEKSGNMTIFNEVNWSSFNEFVPYFKPDINESTFKLVPNLVDIPFFVYQWFGVLPYTSWNLDGQAWTPPYAILEY